MISKTPTQAAEFFDEVIMDVDLESQKSTNAQNGFNNNTANGCGVQNAGTSSGASAVVQAPQDSSRKRSPSPLPVRPTTTSASGPNSTSGSTHRRTSPVAQSTRSNRRRSPSPVSLKPTGSVPVRTNSEPRTTPGRVSPTAQSTRSCRRHSPGTGSIGQNVPSAKTSGGDNDSTRSRTSPTPQSPRSSRRRSPSPGSLANGQFNNGPAESDYSAELDDEEIGLFDFAEELRLEKPPGEPWFMEMTRLRRLHFLWLNRELAAFRKKILEDKRASTKDMKKLQSLLRDQASAIRDFQLVKSLDYLSSGQMEHRRAKSTHYFPNTARSVDPTVAPFETENYRTLPRAPKTALEPFSDEVREFMRAYLPVSITWTKAEMEAKPDWFKEGYAPTTLSPTVDRLARFTIAMAGALFILVPMYVMAIGQSRDKNLITTTVAVVLFALLCSVTLRTSNDQTLGATAGYAAVLMVFVGLTSEPDDAGSS